MTNHNYDVNNIDTIKSILIQIKDCYFENNRGLFHLLSSSIIFENCYFTKIEKNSYDTSRGALFHSGWSSENFIIVDIKDCIFENININSNTPLIHSEQIMLTINNTTFSNCYSDYGYLIDVNKHRYSDIVLKNIKVINSSSMFTGSYCRFTIEDSIFSNMSFKKSVPAISNSKYSIYTIKNTEFNNIYVGNSLFNEESTFIFSNVKLNNITTILNHFYILHIIM
ncbi:hypothetical protein LY90DRAFT_509706 [Neocallimastix californiae]|uniref:Right handed beta helix domain-containing protein n=1 Tax=Neocallimastix californiae TaxID=1754190 RepID=A0A1Y2CB67_9FUNG|nr:hypothetical protein LY90DRAFT_509706 [Neocallimastix californiae]|eukprot:ORY44269.1 hypothetical protein LY90DRAFT_509706 [Neocallimastix californiae]